MTEVSLLTQVSVAILFYISSCNIIIVLYIDSSSNKFF